jgi:TonB family protein
MRRWGAYTKIRPIHSDNGGAVFSHALKHVFAVGLLLIGGWVVTSAPLAWGQEIARKTTSKVAPVYPELARRMHVTGVVKLMVTVSPKGTVKTAKVVGGHPVLLGAARDAVMQWRYEPGPEESTGIVEVPFEPNK